MGFIKQLRMLLTLRAWLRSRGLQAGGAIVTLGAIQTWLSSKDGVDIVMMIATFIHLMPATLGGVLISALGFLIWLLRIKAEWSLSDKVAGLDKLPQPPGPGPGPQP